MVPETLAHYRILRLLGRGGMGEVYLAKDSRLDRTVALKVLAGHVAADPQCRQRFDREAKAIASAAEQADRLGARALVAQAHHLLGLVYTASGQTEEAPSHALTARQMFDAIRKDARDNRVLHRLDLKAFLENVSQ